MTTNLVAFHGSHEIKRKYLTRVRNHRKADNLIQGITWENGKGCAIGCTLESYDHARYPVELGIPQTIARLEDTIFEGLPPQEAQKWPERFLKAITPGTDLTPVTNRVLSRILTEIALPSVLVDEWGVKNAIRGVISVLGDSAAYSSASAASAASAADSAASAADSAAYSSASAADSAAYSSASAAYSSASAADSAASAAYSAAYSSASAASAADSAASAAYSAAYSSASAASAAYSAAYSSASAAYSAARSAAYRRISQILVAELQAASVVGGGA